jgi:hypothetical protein
MRKAFLSSDKPFAALVFAVLALQLFSPFAFAQSTPGPELNPTVGPEATPTPNPATVSPSATPSGAASSATPVPEPSNIGICTISEFTLEEWNKFRQATFNFNGKEVTDKSDAKLRSQTPGQNVIVNNYNFPAEDSVAYIPVVDVAKFFPGRSVEDVAGDLGVAPNESVTIAQVASVTASDPKGANIIAQLRQAVKGKGSANLAPGFESLKVTLPNGRTVAMSELYKLQQIRAGEGQPNACLIDNAAFRGRLEYTALMKQDLLIGADSSGATLNHSACESRECSHITTDSVRAAVNNFEGNFVIQSFYEKAISEIGGWFAWDFLSSGVLAIYSASDLNLATKNIKSTEKYVDDINKMGFEKTISQELVNKGETSVEASALRREFSSKFGSSIVGKEQNLDMPQVVGNKLKSILGKVPAGTGDEAKLAMEKALAQYDSEIAALNIPALESALKAAATDGDSETKLKIISKQLDLANAQRAEILGEKNGMVSMDAALGKYSDILVADGAGKLDVDASYEGLFQKYKAMGKREDQVNFLAELGVISDDQARLAIYRGKLDGIDQRSSYWNSEAAKAERFANFGARRAWQNVLIGLTWLGPGRLGLELAGQIVMTSATKPDATRGDYLLVYINNGDFLNTFRHSTDFFGMGRFLETLSEVTPFTAPYKAYVTSPMYAFQTMGTTTQETGSLTSLTQTDGGWQMLTQWKGDSDLTLVEDVRDGKTWTSTAFKTNYLRFSAALQKKPALRQYHNILLSIGPILSWTVLKVSNMPQGIVTLVQLQLLEFYIDNIVDPNSFSPDEVCSQDKLDGYLRMYKWMVVLSNVEQVALYSDIGTWAGRGLTAMIAARDWTSISKGSKFISKGLGIYRKVQVADPIEWAKASYGHLALEYSLSCKDPSYKVVAYQKIPEASQKASAVTAIKKKVSDPLGIDKITNGLNVGEAFKGIGQTATQADLKEILNLKSLEKNQNGLLKPADINYIHLYPEGADMQWWGVFENQCFRNCMQQSDGTFVCADGNGVYLERNGTRIDLADRERALMSDFLPSLGLVVPNKIITAPLDCSPDSAVLEARSDATLNVIDGGCPATDCAMKSLVRVSGKNVGNDLSEVMGPVEVIYTTQGIASRYNNEYRFMRTKGVRTQELSTILKVPIPFTNRTEVDLNKNGATGSNQKSLAGTEERYRTVQIMGDGRVRSDSELGELLTIQMQNGVIHFDRATRKLYVLIKILAMAPGRDITGISAAPATVAGPKADLDKLARDLDSLKAALASGQQLNAAQLELLKSILEKGAPTGQLLNKEERDKLAAILDKQSKGISLNQAESDLLKKAQSEDKFPGVIVLPPEKTQTIEKTLKEQGVDPTLVKQIIDKLTAGTPLSAADKAAAQDALDKSAAAGKLSADQASTLKADLEKTISAASRANEIANAAALDKLTAEQKALAIKVAQDEADAARARAKTASDNPTPAIKLGGVTAKVGAEQSAQDLNRALEKVGGFTDLSTEKTALQFATNANGESVLRTADKATGATQELKITGAPTRDGNAVVIPTDKGLVKIDVNVNKDNGAPVVNINGAGLRDSSALILAQGPGGMLFFDPKTGTWQVRNGAAIGADGAFGTNGISYYGSPDGTRGLPQQGALGYNQILGSSSGNNPLLALPSWPEQPPLAAAMLALVLLGVLAVRFRRN